MTNNSINQILDNAEGIYEIDLVNQSTRATYTKAAVRGENTLQQIVEEYSRDIGVDPSKRIVFTNKKTGASTSDSSETVKGFGLLPGYVLAFCDSGDVAGEDVIEIDIVNKSTGATYSKAPVHNENTLKQIVDEYAEDIGLNRDSKIVFQNKRTGAATSDSSETVKGLGLLSDDVLVIGDSCVVAGEDVIEIDIVNKSTGATYSKAPVHNENTLKQIVDEYAEDIGLNRDSKIVFQNKRTGAATSDSSETVKGLGLLSNDVLLIGDSCVVAGSITNSHSL